MGDELKILAWRYNNRPGWQRGDHTVSVSLSKLPLRDALSDPRVCVATLADERAWPSVPSREALTEFTAWHLQALCRRANLAVAGGKEDVIERLCAAAGYPLSPQPDAPADEPARAQRERNRRRWQTPLFGVLDVRNLPLSYRLCEQPPQVRCCSGVFFFFFFFFFFLTPA